MSWEFINSTSGNIFIDDTGISLPVGTYPVPAPDYFYWTDSEDIDDHLVSGTVQFQLDGNLLDAESAKEVIHAPSPYSEVYRFSDLTTKNLVKRVNRRFSFFHSLDTEDSVSGDFETEIKVHFWAHWIGTRYYAVDYDNGDDSNVGFSDTSMADAGTKALKTIERLHQILPTNGNGQKAVVAIRKRSGGATYRNIADDADDYIRLNGPYFGYEQLIFRGTGDVSTANATAFANDDADKIALGAQTATGTDSGGYNPTGTPGSTTFNVQLNGGGAANLSAEPDLLGFRVRFAYNTATSALQNATAMIWANTSSQITVSPRLPAAPSTSDVFYIEEPGVVLDRAVVHSNNQYLANVDGFFPSGIQLVGLQLTNSGVAIHQRGALSYFGLSFIYMPNSNSFAAISSYYCQDLRISYRYTDENPTFIAPGAGWKAGGCLTCVGGASLVMDHNACTATRTQILNTDNFNIGAGCVHYGGILFQNCGSPPAITNLGGNILGNAGSSRNARYRTLTSQIGDVFNITRTSLNIYGAQIENAGSSPLILIKGVGLSIGIHDCIGSTGNTGNGLDLTLARDCNFLMGTLGTNTFTGAAGQDIATHGNVYYVHADYARTDLKDRYGNHIQGNGNSILGSVVYASNDGSGSIGQYKLCRATSSNSIRTAQANSLANASGIVGVSQSSASAGQSTMLCNGGGTWVQFDSTPTVGNIAYLSEATAGNARDTPPASAGTNQKLRLGRILRVSGTLGYVALFIESLPVTSDGLA